MDTHFVRVRLDRILGHARDLEGEGGGRGSRSHLVKKLTNFMVP